MTGAVAFVVGLINIGRSFNYDEAITYASFINGGSPWKALTTQVVFNNHQMFSVGQSLLWRLGLTGETPQRLAPVLCGVATVGLLTWWLGRYLSVVAGVVAGFALLLNPVYLVEFRLLRGYALATLAVLVAVVATHRSWFDPRRRWFVTSGVAMTVAVTTHAYSAVAFAMLAVVAAVLGNVGRRHLATWAIAAIAAVIIQWPLLDDARRASEARGNVYQPRFVRFTAEFYLGDRTAVIVIFSVLAVVGLVTLSRRSIRHAIALASATALFGLVVILLWQVVQPRDLYARFFVTLTPYLAALIGAGAAAIPYRLGLVAAAVGLVLLVPNARTVVDVDPSLRRAADVIEAGRAAGLVVCGASTEAIAPYTAPPRAFDARDPEAYQDCELFVAVLGIGSAGEAIADERFDQRIRAGNGVTIWTSAEFAPTVSDLTRRD